MPRFLVLVLFLISSVSNADEIVDLYQTGDTISSITLKDQHDETISIDETTQLLLFATGMPAGKVVRKVIDKESVDFLTKNNTIFLSDISGMPGMIAKMFALPKMRKHHYSILLDREGKLTKNIPSQDGKVTVIRLDKLKVNSITFTKDSSFIKKVIMTPVDQ